MIWSSRARNRSPEFVLACFFGRIVPSDATTESCFAPQGNPENEIAGFCALNPQNLAISKPPGRQKTTLNQRPNCCSRTTKHIANDLAIILLVLHHQNTLAHAVTTCCVA